MAICIPFGWMNLEDNMGFQWLSCIGTIVFTLEFIYEFIKRVVPGAPLYCPGNGPSRTPPFLLQQHQVRTAPRRHCSGDHPPLLPSVPQLPLVLGMPWVEQGSPVHQEGRPPQVPAHHSLMAVIPRTHPSQVACF
jgi:hypothetical protein